MSGRRGGHHKGKKPVRGRGHSFTPVRRLAASARAASASYGSDRQDGEDPGLWGHENRDERDSDKDATSDDEQEPGSSTQKEGIDEDSEKTSESQSSRPRRAHRDESAENESDDDKDDSSLRRFGTQNAPIDIENPNRAVRRDNLKASDIASSAPREISRREREAAEKAAARRRYMQLHAEGKTEQAQADLARLAIVRQQREEAAMRRKAEAEAKEAANKARLEREGRKPRNP